MFVDTHCHLDAPEFDADRAQIASAAMGSGVACIVIPSVERSNFAAVASVCREFPACRAAFGIHPMYVERASEDDLEVLRDLLSAGSAVAVGEIGLDHFVEPRDDARQMQFFAAQLELARQTDLPVLLHVRRAIDPILSQLRRIPVCGGIAHAFNGSRQQADAFIKLGFKLGFGGAMTHPRALRIRELATTLPLDAIVLETDAPDIAPEWLHGGRNSPQQLPRIAAVLAELRGMPVEHIAEVTSNNAVSVLPQLSLH